MATSPDDRGLFIEITATGQIKPSAGLAAKLAQTPGLWRLVSEVGQLLVLERLVDNRHRTRAKGTERQIRIAGVFDNVGILASVINLIQINRWDGVLHVSKEQVRNSLLAALARVAG